METVLGVNHAPRRHADKKYFTQSNIAIRDHRKPFQNAMSEKKCWKCEAGGAEIKDAAVRDMS